MYFLKILKTPLKWGKIEKNFVFQVFTFCCIILHHSRTGAPAWHGRHQTKWWKWRVRVDDKMQVKIKSKCSSLKMRPESEMLMPKSSQKWDSQPPSLPVDSWRLPTTYYTRNLEKLNSVDETRTYYSLEKQKCYLTYRFWWRNSRLDEFSSSSNELQTCSFNLDNVWK